MAFAGNSLLCRLALLSGVESAAPAGPLWFTALRLLGGAVVLAPVLFVGRGSGAPHSGGPCLRDSIPCALVLCVYAIAFSLSYVTLPAGIGALVLFGTVQVLMLGTARLRGEPMGARQWVGFAVAAAGLAVLVGPGAWLESKADPIDPLGAGLMVLAGVGWAAYTLLGRSAKSTPTAFTALNFLLAAPFALGFLALAAGLEAGALTLRGAWLAITAGAVTSGCGYVLWYAALRGHSRTSAASVQLTVPLIAALGGVLFLGESITARFGISAALILGGVALTLQRRP